MEHCESIALSGSFWPLGRLRPNETGAAALMAGKKQILHWPDSRLMKKRAGN